MDTILGEDHKSTYLTLVEQCSKITVIYKLKVKLTEEVLKALKKILEKSLKTIITCQGKEFSNWKQIEKKH